MLPMSESLFVEKALSEVCQALKTLQQFNSCISVQKFITILRKTDRQNSAQSSYPVASFLLVIVRQPSALKKASVPELSFISIKKATFSSHSCIAKTSSLPAENHLQTSLQGLPHLLQNVLHFLEILRWNLLKNRTVLLITGKDCI